MGGRPSRETIAGLIFCGSTRSLRARPQCACPTPPLSFPPTRHWNKPVHNFLLRHCYVDAMRQGFSPNAALYFTFLVSIVVHELLLWGAFGLTVRRRRGRRRRLWATVQYGACAYTILTL